MRRDIVSRATDNIAFRPFASRTLGSRLGFRLADGRMKSLQYTHLTETEFNPDVGIILEFVGHRVTLAGHNLFQLYYEIEAEEVGEIIERHSGDLALADGSCYVRQIHWERL